MKNKIVLFLISILLFNSNIFGQGRDRHDSSAMQKSSNYLTEIYKHNYPKLSLGVGIGFSNMFGDFSSSIPAPVVRIGLRFRANTNIGLELETYFGRLSSKESPQYWESSLFSETSTFESVDILAKITLGNYLQYPHGILLKILSDVYIGTGIGFVNSNITSFTGRYSSADLNVMLDNGAFTRKQVFTPFIPVNIGLRIPLKRFLGSIITQLVVNYQINFTFSDYLDGYKYIDNSSNNRNQFNDCFSLLTIGLSFHLSKK